jgi:hypothetical protein
MQRFAEEYPHDIISILIIFKGCIFMIKRLFIIMLVLSVILTAIIPAYATDAVIAKPASSTVIVNGQVISFDSYEIGNNNYFKLRDIGLAFNFGVTWDGANNTVVIDTDSKYSE